PDDSGVIEPVDENDGFIFWRPRPRKLGWVKRFQAVGGLDPVNGLRVFFLDRLSNPDADPAIFLREKTT
ncbi:MAG: hypothetical protein PVH30_11955, partial [Desulfobacterales bacterium]